MAGHVRKVRERPTVGATVIPGEGVRFRVWAPRAKTVEVVLEAGPGTGSADGPETIRLDAEDGGYASGFAPEAGAGLRYRYRLDGGTLVADPASRFQPDGPEGASQVVDPWAFSWSDQDWPGVPIRGAVLYELQIGTFTQEGTWTAATAELPRLAALGVNVLEVMPVNEYPGRFGWSYDGTFPFAPSHNYGDPDDFRRFVDRAHACGLGVILDVVYNHCGSTGCALGCFSEDYFSDRHHTEWGQAMNFDGPDSEPVREFFLTNAASWIEEYHIDGFRIDATQAFFDDSDEHILSAIARRAREAARGREVLIVGESEPQAACLARPVEEGGQGLDALTNDDFHHVAHVAATGNRDAYYSDYHGLPQEFVSLLKRGFLYQGQRNVRQDKRRGSPSFDLSPEQFIHYLQSHDQIANSLRGHRLHELTDPGSLRALTALLLLGPQTPMLFQGQEFAASSPFLYFGDFDPETARQMHQGRKDFLAQFPALATKEAQKQIPNPADPATFTRSKLNQAERNHGPHAWAFRLHRDLLRLRREDEVFRAQGLGGLDGAVLAPQAFAVRHFAGGGNDRLLVVNLGSGFLLTPVTEPLLAPPEQQDWAVLWASEDLRYGGQGVAPVVTDQGWRLPGRAALVLKPAKRKEKEPDHG